MKNLEIKYRPKSLDEMIGNEETLDMLESIMDSKDIPHCFLFTGPSGCGKTTLARIVAKILKCSDTDFHELNTADFRGIETARKLVSRIVYLPTEGDCQIWLCDECHQLTKDAQEALLKIMEECPKHAYLLFATTEPEKLKPTFKRRCHHLTVERLSEKKLLRHMKKILEKEKAEIPEDVLEQIAFDSIGSPAMALSILGSIINVDEDRMLEAAKRKAEEKSQTIELCRALLKGNSWKTISAILSNLNEDPERIRRAVLAYCQTALLNGNTQAYVVMDAFRETFFYTEKPGLTMACYETLK